MDDESIIKEGDNVIFKRNDACRAFQIRRNRQVFFERNKFSVSELIGQPYGTTFEIDKGKLNKVEKPMSAQCYSTVLDPSSDNRDLQDLDSNQKMSKEDIMKMKEEGVTGEKIIEELIENSETFKTKTEFSQAKYLKKKKKKHILGFTVLRPTPRLVLNIYAKEPQKICNLRADSLSQILSYSNIMSGSNVAVVETCHGLVMASVLQRLAGQGKLIQLVPNSSSQVYRQCMNYFGFSKADFSNVYTFPMSVLTDLQNPNTPDSTNRPVEMTNDDKGNGESQEHSSKRSAIECDKNNEDIKTESIVALDKNDSKDDISDSDQANNLDGGQEVNPKRKNPEAQKLGPNRELQRQARAVRHKQAADVIMAKELDALIVASKYNPAPIVKKMVHFLPPSRNVVVFCQFMEPLVEIYTFIKEMHIGLQLKLSETWLREYQILPQRTHPMMNMTGNGGYLLTFTTCDPTTCS